MSGVFEWEEGALAPSFWQLIIESKQLLSYK